MHEILIAPNSFKECADSVRLTSLFHEALESLLTDRHRAKDFRFIDKPVSDGGDGFLEVCRENFHLDKKETSVPAPFEGENLSAPYGYSRQKKTVYIESAEILGMKLIPKDKRHPMKLSSGGLGHLLLYLKNEKASGRLDIERAVIGIGGTGTSDFGIGMASALGLKMLDKNNRELEAIPKNFSNAVEIKWEDPRLGYKIEAVLDVNVPLLGKNGAARVFAAQKGATPEEVEKLEQGLENVVMILGKKKTTENLLGAGGGLAGGLHFFLDADYKFARDFLREDLGINRMKLKPGLIVTGEGAFDAQSLMQKGVSLILEEFMDTEIPQFICAGIIKDIPAEMKKKNLHFIEISGFFKSPEESMRNVEKGILLASEEILKIFFANRG